jgi:protoporphyrin/coproporphyrin ferrochelatase
MKTGVLIAQLGTPDNASPDAVRRFLKEFLSDSHVIQVNPILWFFILNFIILRTRPKKSALLYERFFRLYGRTLMTYSQSLTRQLQPWAEKQDLVIDFGMRYGTPSLTRVLKNMVEKQGCERIVVIPLFPQFSDTTTGSIQDLVYGYANSSEQKIKIEFLSDYHNHPLYIKSLASSIQSTLDKKDSPPDYILLSYHGIPFKYATKGDVYPQHCLKTTELLKRKLNFDDKKILHMYQSRFGKEEWLKPYTDKTLIELAQQGAKNVVVCCPGFSMDCLETLDEIAVENQRLFIKHGGDRLEFVSCLNDQPEWVKHLSQIIEEVLKN